MSQFTINLIWDQSVLNQPNAAQIEASLTSIAEVFASNFSNSVTLDLHVGWGEVHGQIVTADAIAESDPQLVSRSSSAVSGAISGLPYLGNGASPIELTDVQAAAVGLSSNTTVDGYIGFSAASGDFAFSSLDAGQAEYILADVFAHEVTEVMGRVSNVGSFGPAPRTVLDIFRYSAPGVTTVSASTPAYFSRDRGATNEAWFNINPSGDTGDWSTAVSSDAFDAFAGTRVAGYISQADQDVMSALGWMPTSAAWDGVFINSETEAWLGRSANSGDLYSFASDLANAWTPDQIRQQLLQYPEGRAHTDASVTGLYETFMGRDPSSAELSTWEGLVMGGDDFGAVRSAILSDASGRAHTDATITSLYETWFGRNPTASELSVWEGLVAEGDDFAALRLALVADPASHAQTDANIVGEYQTWFGRAPSAGELSVWEGLIRGGDDLSALRSALISDGAGQAHIAQTVAGLYESYLFRAPTTAEVATWDGLLAGGATFGDLSAALVQAQVQTETAIPALYQSYMGRAPTPAEAAYWDGQVVSAGATAASIRQAIVDDGGGQAYLSKSITALYDTWFGRDPSPAETRVWLGAFASGGDLSTLRAALIADAAGQSFISQTLSGLYETYLNRAATSSELSGWQRSIAGGSSFADVTFDLALQEARLTVPAHPDNDTTAVYETYDGRPPTPAELSFDLGAGASVINIRSYVLSSPEAQNYLTSQVTSLYDDYLGRDPTALELSQWRGLIDSQDDYHTVRATLLLLPAGEAHTANTVTALYDTYFGRDPTSGELSVWNGLVAHGDEFADVRSALLSDAAGRAHTEATVESLYETIFARAPAASELGVWEGLIGGGAGFDQLRDALLRDPGSIGCGVHQVVLGAGQSFSLDSGWSGAALSGFDPLRDIIHLSANEFGALNPLDVSHARQITALDGTPDVLITLDPAHTLLIEHTALASLTPSDFVFG